MWHTATPGALTSSISPVEVVPVGPTKAAMAAVSLAPATGHGKKARPAFGVFLGPLGYTLAWCGIYVLYAVCAAYFLVAGLAYHVLPTTHLAGLITYYSLSLDPTYFRRISTVHFGFAALFAALLLAPLVAVVFRYCHRRSLCCQSRTASIQQRTATLVASLHRPRALDSTLKRSSLSSVLTAIKPTRVGRLVAFVYGQKRLLDVESRDFELFFLVRELAETMLQAYQAYSMTRLLPRQQLNRFYVTILVVNCWSTPLLHRVGGRNEALQRLLCLLWDFGLDFVSVVGVPVWLALDYLVDYDPTTKTFHFLLFYDDTWMIRLLNDTPQILLNSWLEAFSRLVFSLSMLSTISDVKRLLKRKPPTTTRRNRSRVGVDVDVVKTSVVVASPSLQPSPCRATHQRERFVRWAHRLMVGFGVLILGVHCHAELKPDPPLCVLQIRPWLTSLPACALVEINCVTTPQLTGDRTQFNAIFARVDTASLLQIVVRHCPHLELTPQLLTFPNLLAFKTYNATIAAWPTDAALTLTSNLHLEYIYFVRTSFANGTLPDGLRLTRFSPNFKVLTFCSTNLHTLHDTLHETWPPHLSLYVEHSALTAYPLVLNKLRPSDVSLKYNQITHLPAEVFLLEGIVALTGNPLTSLPDAVDVAMLATDVLATDVLVDLSNLTHPLPLWLDEAFVAHTTLYLGGSPFCVEVALNATSEVYAELLATRPWLVDGRVDCSIFDLIFYPLGVDVRETNGIVSS